jgi:hypothetical protein
MMESPPGSCILTFRLKPTAYSVSPTRRTNVLVRGPILAPVDVGARAIGGFMAAAAAAAAPALKSRARFRFLKTRPGGGEEGAGANGEGEGFLSSSLARSLCPSTTLRPGRPKGGGEWGAALAVAAANDADDALGGGFFAVPPSFEDFASSTNLPGRMMSSKRYTICSSFACASGPRCSSRRRRAGWTTTLRRLSEGFLCTLQPPAAGDRKSSATASNSSREKCSSSSWVASIARATACRTRSFRSALRFLVLLLRCALSRIPPSWKHRSRSSAAAPSSSKSRIFSVATASIPRCRSRARRVAFRQWDNGTVRKDGTAPPTNSSAPSICS